MYSISCFSMLSLDTPTVKALTAKQAQCTNFSKLVPIGKEPLCKIFYSQKPKHSTRFFQSSVLIKNWSKFSLCEDQ